MYIELSSHKGDFITHIEHFIFLGYCTKVYSPHRPMIQTMNHIITNDHMNLLQSTVAFPIFVRLIQEFLVKEGDQQLSLCVRVPQFCSQLPKELSDYPR